MSCINRVAHRRLPYSQLGNAMIRDKRVSTDARFALVFILTHPADWQFTTEWLREELGFGRDRVRAAIAELRQHGYCRAFREKLPSGQFGRLIYEFTDLPEGPAPEDQGPADEGPAGDGSPGTGLPASVDQGDNSTKKVRTKKEENIGNRPARNVEQDAVRAGGPKPDDLSDLNDATATLVSGIARIVNHLSPDYVTARRWVGSNAALYGFEAVRDGYAELMAAHETPGRIVQPTLKTLIGFVKTAAAAGERAATKARRGGSDYDRRMAATQQAMRELFGTEGTP